MKIIGYGKLGRSMPLTLDKCGNLGGDVECAAVVGEMARRHPNDRFVLLGRNTGEKPSDVGLPDNVFNPWVEWGPELRQRINDAGLNKGTLTSARQLLLKEIFTDITLPAFVDCDAHVWWVGQHGTSNTPIPKVHDRDALTKPQDWCAYYSSFVFTGINAWRDLNPLTNEEIYLNADPRNYHKMRDLKWPLCYPILTQHTFSHTLKHERYGDPRTPAECGFNSFVDRVDPGVWVATTLNTYARLEVNGLAPETPFGKLISFNPSWVNRNHFGLFINEAGQYGKDEVRRVNIFRDWIAPLSPAWVHGTWSQESIRALGRAIVPAPWEKYYPCLHSVHSTITTPSSGSGWATCKPWEAFAAGTVCFFHPLYDVQNNILGDAPNALREFLRVATPRELSEKVHAVHNNESLWYDVISMQRDHFNKAMRDLTYMRKIEDRIYGE